MGILTVASDGVSITALTMDGQKYEEKHLREMNTESADKKEDIIFPDQELSVFLLTRQWLDRYFAGLKPVPGEFPLALSGTAFQKRVWTELLTIPYGETMTYGEIADRLNTSARAVGNAVGRNPVSIIIPCHRVIGGDGKLTGYAGGIERKRWLLEHERKGNI